MMGMSMNPHMSILEAMMASAQRTESAPDHKKPLLDIVRKHFPTAHTIVVKGSGARWAAGQGFDASKDDLDMLIVIPDEDATTLYSVPEVAQVSILNLVEEVKGAPVVFADSAGSTRVKGTADAKTESKGDAKRGSTTAVGSQSAPSATRTLSVPHGSPAVGSQHSPLTQGRAQSSAALPQLALTRAASGGAGAGAGAAAAHAVASAAHAASSSVAGVPVAISATAEVAHHMVHDSGHGHSHGAGGGDHGHSHGGDSHGHSHGGGGSAAAAGSEPVLSPMSASQWPDMLGVESPDARGEKASLLAKSDAKSDAKADSSSSGTGGAAASASTAAASASATASSGSEKKEDSKDGKDAAAKPKSPPLGLTLEPLVVSEKRLQTAPLVVVALSGVSTLNGIATYQFREGTVVMGKVDTVRKIPSLTLHQAVRETAPLAFNAAVKCINVIDTMKSQGRPIGSDFVVQNYELFRRLSQVVYVKDMRALGSKMQVGAHIKGQYPQFAGIGNVLMEMYGRAGRVKSQEPAKVIVGSDEIKGFLNYVGRACQQFVQGAQLGTF